MTNREMLMVIKDAAPSLKHIKEVAEKIISNTYDYNIEYVNHINVNKDNVIVNYEYKCRGEWGSEDIIIPIKWFNEGFDYKSAYEKILRKEEANRKRAEKVRLKQTAEMKKRADEMKKRAKEIKEKKEYETFLKLKKKYESKE